MDIKACSVESAAETLGLEPEDVLELVKIGKLDAIQLKSKTIIPIVAIDNFLCGFSTLHTERLHLRRWFPDQRKYAVHRRQCAYRDPKRRLRGWPCPWGRRSRR